MKHILSGVQPSGKLHIGNYFGAIKQHIELQAEGTAFIFIADWHALTTVHNARELRANILDCATSYLALGLDPKKAFFFRHSHVPQIQEIAWLLATVTGKGLLDRAVSYKDKVSRGLDANVGLFTYPILMAADILAYRSDIVPVGHDQIPHVQMAQDIATHFNTTYNYEVFKRPEYRLSTAPKIPGIDGQKMSKSYDNTIEIFDSGDVLKEKIMRIKTDSTPVESPKDPEQCTLFALYSLFVTDKEKAELAESYRTGGTRYSDVKKSLLERIDTFFSPYRARREELLKSPDYVHETLADGAEWAQKYVQATLDIARRACGLD